MNDGDVLAAAGLQEGGGAFDDLTGGGLEIPGREEIVLQIDQQQDGGHGAGLRLPRVVS